MGSYDPADTAFADMFRRMSPRVYAYARRHCDATEAEDVVSETFTVAWRRHSDVPDEPLPWLLTVARNIVANRHRGDRRRDQLVDALTRLATVAGTPGGPDEEPGQRHVMLRALADLAVAEREAVLLVAWDGLSNREAAAVFGCSAHAFEVRLSRARARLARSMAVNDEPQPARLGDAVRRRTWSTDGRASS